MVRERKVCHVGKLPGIDLARKSELKKRIKFGRMGVRIQVVQIILVSGKKIQHF